MARAISPTLLAHLQARRGYRIRLLLWAQPRNPGTGLREEIGIWTGSTNREFTIGGETRTYLGGGGVLQIENIVSATGLDIRNQRAALNGLFPEVLALSEDYDARQAPVEIHRAFFSTETLELLDAPQRLFKGTIDKAVTTRAEAGGTATVELTMVSTARNLTQVLAARQSDASQQLRSGDRFLRHADISGEVPVVWGEAGPSDPPRPLPPPITRLPR
jgi:hypothetical protein